MPLDICQATDLTKPNCPRRPMSRIGAGLLETNGVARHGRVASRRIISDCTPENAGGAYMASK
eukprot:8302731-Pyramimonas_sp.AAC.1